MFFLEISGFSSQTCYAHVRVFNWEINLSHITFIHGIANKPNSEDLLHLWRSAISNSRADLNLGSFGVTTSMVYWADVMYAKPFQGADFESTQGAAAEVGDDVNPIEKHGENGSLQFIEKLAERLGVPLEEQNEDADKPPAADFESLKEPNFEAIPLPRFIKRRLMKTFVRDVHAYLFNVAHSPRPGETYRVRDHIRSLFVDQLKKDIEQNDEGPLVVVAHSMGTVIAYDCLKNVEACPSVDGLLTIGSPLGLSEVQNELEPGFSFNDGYASKAGSWSNFFDRLDPVALDANLSNDYKQNGIQIIDDQRVVNNGLWRHTATDYLAQNDFVDLLGNMLGVENSA